MTIDKWNGDRSVSGGHSLCDACNRRDRPRYAARNDYDSRERQSNGAACKDTQQQRGIVNGFVNSGVNPARGVAVVLAERDEVLTQGVANLGRLIFGCPFTSGLSSRLLGNGRKLIERVLIVVKPDRKIAERQS